MVPTHFKSDNIPNSGMGFQTTHWSEVLSAAQADDSINAQQALARLYSAYWYPLYAFCRRQGSPPADAEDLTQEFFARFLAKNALASVRPENGRFRSFLLACLKNFLANERVRAQSQRRGGSQPVFSLDGMAAEARYSLEPAANETPETLFERQWAYAVLERTMLELSREHATNEKRELFEQLKGFLPCERGSLTRTEIAAKRGVSVGAIDVAIHRLRQRFGALLREQVAATVLSEADINDEIQHLINVLSH